VQLTLTYLDGDLGSVPLVLKPAAGSSGSWGADSTAVSQPGQWQADLLVRRQGQDDVRSTMRFTVALGNATPPTDSLAAYPPLPSWLPLGLAAAAAFTLLSALMLMLLRTRTTQRQAPLEAEDLRGLPGGRDPLNLSDVDRAREAVGAGQARQSASRATREEEPGA
jgi:predicted outer membrane lipoprotein